MQSSTTHILVIGRHQEIMETVLRLLHTQPTWKAEGALTDQEAIAKFSYTPFDCVLIGGGVEKASETSLKLEFKKLRPQTPVVRHYGGGSGLLFNEVEMALGRNNGHSVR